MRRELTLEELNGIVESVGELEGWDFSRVRDARDPVPWDYADLVCRYLEPSHRVLDIGTGGGERFLALAPYFGVGVGIDHAPSMVQRAWKNTPPSLAGRVFFELMDGGDLRFPDASFDVVLNRHATVCPAGIARVLRPGGTFITQQVGRRNTSNVFAAFGWAPDSFGDDWWQSMDALAEEFRQHGCAVVAWGEYDVRYWFLDVESFVFWLKAVPLPEVFDVEQHWPGVNRLLGAAGAPQGIETNEHRELLVVQKRESR
jgi:SAM-dependent methyltransferase